MKFIIRDRRDGTYEKNWYEDVLTAMLYTGSNKRRLLFVS